MAESSKILYFPFYSYLASTINAHIYYNSSRETFKSMKFDIEQSALIQQESRQYSS